MQELVEKLQRYAKEYKNPPYGREIEGTPELLLAAADSLKEAEESIQKLKARFVDGMEVHRQGNDESDGIECPFCGYEVALNDDYDEMRPKHCPECGTKLIY
ncbi:MAG: hypothetical protein ACI4FX_10865 [Agathobacter sp.]